jgi:hypothetical protein
MKRCEGGDALLERNGKTGAPRPPEKTYSYIKPVLLWREEKGVAKEARPGKWRICRPLQCQFTLLSHHDRGAKYPRFLVHHDHFGSWGNGGESPGSICHRSLRESLLGLEILHRFSKPNPIVPSQLVSVCPKNRYGARLRLFGYCPVPDRIDESSIAYSLPHPGLDHAESNPH